MRGGGGDVDSDLITRLRSTNKKKDVISFKCKNFVEFVGVFQKINSK